MLNIKNPETHRLATQLAQHTGQTLTAAITDAIKEKLDRLGGNTELADELLAIGKDCARRLPEAVRTLDHAALLYNDQGLPR